ncbi:Ig-like domain-containing protein [Marivirga sp. S37H4]|uniref:Ig-like domain-containing protein n=1 Tax=Marivirga aurantiaca TaxID=2802615 RepID=A0A934X293_9BACT|nr:Ig-like domain-containing domain [Marivirga aurantiaca]MBK6267152.1 Ig-like domain-containing protein [Marivirga aurantiaca]
MNKLIPSLLIILIIYACATVQSPVGGEKDTKPPELYESNPGDQSTNFKGNKITLYFNEWMEVDNLNKELIITPRTNVEYEHTLKKQEFTLTFKKPLKDSTTYTFNFRKALKDITEGNLWEDPVIAFSTGSYLDSLEVHGEVIHLMTNSPAEEFTVGLYDAIYDTANLRQGEPVYFTTTDKEGKYLLQNIRPGKYRLYAFNDSNDNLKNESSSEAYAFHGEIIELQDSIPPINLEAYQNNEDTLTIKKASPSGKDFVINFNKGIKNYQVENSKDTSQFIYVNDEESAKNLRIYKENFPDLAYEEDSIALYITVTDSIQMSLKDTVYAKFRESRIQSEELKITQMPTKEILSGLQKLEIAFNKPINKYNTDSIFIKYDSLLLYEVADNQLAFSKNRKKVNITIPLLKSKIDSIDAYYKKINDSIQSVRQQQSDSVLNDQGEEVEVDDNQTSNKTEKPNKINLGSKGAKQQGIPATTSSKNTTPQIKGLHLYLGKGAFIGIENDSTASNNSTFQFMESENYGTIKGSVQNASQNFIVELVDSKHEKVDSVSNKEEFTFNYVKPGDYYLRAIIDRNNNNKWDAGNPLLLIPEEEIVYLDEKITVKANWEVIDKILVLTPQNNVDNNQGN